MSSCSEYISELQAERGFRVVAGCACNSARV